MARKLETVREYLHTYPRVTAHIIAGSLGYATPTKAAMILMHAHRNEPDHCEWVDAIYQRDARACVKDCISQRHYHKGFMADYTYARQLVERARETGKEPELASWF